MIFSIIICIFATLLYIHSSKPINTFSLMRYLDPKADLTFKKIFGEHKDLLISLLNALLPLADDEQIESVEYLSPELVPDTYVGKNSIVDVRCRDVKNRQFIVEMQMDIIFAQLIISMLFFMVMFIYMKTQKTQKRNSIL